jgi:hypothetical protein
MAVLALASASALGLWSLYRGMTAPFEVYSAKFATSRPMKAAAVPSGPDATTTSAPRFGPEHPLYSGPPRDAQTPNNIGTVVAAQAEQSLRAEPASGALSSMGLHIMRDAAGSIVGMSGNVPYEWSRAGVMNSDLITAVDGVSIPRLLAVPSAVVRLATQKNARLTVMRDGKSTTIVAGDRPLTPMERARQIRERQLYGR